MYQQTWRPLPDGGTQSHQQRRFLPFIALIFAAVLLTGCVYAWQRQARQKALSQAVETVENAFSNTDAMEEIRTGLEKSFEGARDYAKKILSVDPKKPSARETVHSLANQALHGNKNIFAAWFVFEPDAFDGRDAQYGGKDGFGETGRMAGLVSRTSDAVDRDPFPEDSAEGDGVYRKILESGKEGLYRVYTHVEMDMPRLFSSIGYGGISPSFPGSTSGYVKETPCAVLGVPVKRNGKTIGAAGLDVLLGPLNDALYLFQLPYAIETFLVSDTGYITATSEKWRLGDKLEDLYLSGLADFIGADDTASEPNSGRWHFGKDGSALYCRRFRVGNGEGLWSLAFFAPPEFLYGNIREITAATLIGGYVVLLLIGGIVLLVRRAKTVKRDAGQNADVSALLPSVDPVTAERLKALNRQNAICRLLAVLFFMPSVFFMAGAEKQLREATAEGNLQKAEEAVRKLWTAAIIGLCIGIPLLILYISTSEY